MIAHQWQGQTFWLTKDRVMYWEQQNCLIASDLHIGKTGHFRKNGIAVPQHVFKEDLQRLFASLQYFKPEKFIIVGDLFHSHANKELELFSRWRADFGTLDFILVKGNHDILAARWYQDNNITVVDCLDIGGLRFIHDKDCEQEAGESINGFISGHVHPAVVLSPGPRQAIRLPCFYFNEQHCILPAYGKFTGTYAVKPQKKDAVFAITNSEVLNLHY